MARLEYRLLDERNGFPVLYYYAGIDKDEVALRFSCDYFVKEKTIYEKTSNAVEDSCYVIYVKIADDEKVVDSTLHPLANRAGIRLEVREYKEDTTQYPLLHTYEFREEREALLHLQSNFLYLQDREYEKTSTEVDEDRKVYVMYAKPTT